MSGEYLIKREHVVIEDDVHAILDLKKAGEVDWYTSAEYDLVAWNKEEKCVFGLLKQTGNSYQLPENGARLCEAFLTMRMRTFDTAFQNIELRRDQSSSKAPTNDEQQQRR